MSELGADQDRMGTNEGEQMGEIKEKEKIRRVEVRAAKEEEQRWKGRREEGKEEGEKNDAQRRLKENKEVWMRRRSKDRWQGEKRGVREEEKQGREEQKLRRREGENRRDSERWRGVEEGVGRWWVITRLSAPVGRVAVGVAVWHICRKRTHRETLPAVMLLKHLLLLQRRVEDNTGMPLRHAVVHMQPFPLTHTCI